MKFTMKMAELRSGTAGVLIMLNVLLLSSEGHDVQTGSDITRCSMKCPDNSTVLSLYKVCGGNETHLVELRCDDMSSSDVTEPRFYLNVSSGCWTLSGAEKSDSCSYTLRLHNSSGSFPLSTDVTVLDPEPSLSPDPGSSGNTTSVVLAVVGGIVLCLLPFIIVLDCKKKLKDLESDGGNDHSEEHGGLSGSSPDAALLVDPVEISYNGYLLREDRAEESHERDQQNMEERTLVTAPGVAQN